MKYILFIFIGLLSWGCNVKPADTTTGSIEITDTLEIKYAQGFDLYKSNKGYIVVNKQPFPGAVEEIKYLISSEVHNASDEFIVVRSSDRIICTSTSHIPLLTYLGVENHLAGFPNTDYISNEKVRALIDQEKVVDVGNAEEINLEKVLEVAPNWIMAYSMNHLKSIERLENTGNTVVINSDFLESSPLGRAEWIKVMGVLFNKYEESAQIFADIEKEYNRYAKKNPEGPCVFSGNLYGDSWFMPGGNNYAANLLKDAGFQYTYDDNPESGFLQLSFESVFSRSSGCDYWIAPAPFESLEALGAADKRYTGFDAFQHQQVYVYDNQVGATGGNVYLEEGYLRPDLILKDLIEIRSPGSISEHKLYFYRRLN